MAYLIHQEKFDGPLELLYDLIQRNEFAISEISLSRVTDDYLAYIRSLEEIDPEQLAQFLVVAAQLILIKSRALLPSFEVSNEDEKSLDELEKRLKEYARIREYAWEIQKILEAHLYMRARDAFYGREVLFYPPPRLCAADLARAFGLILDALPKKEILVQEKIRRVLTLEEKAEHIRVFIQQSLERSFTDFVKNAKDKVEIIVSFLALLELARQKFLELRQEKLFEDISIKKIEEIEIQS